MSEHSVHGRAARGRTPPSRVLKMLTLSQSPGMSPSLHPNPPTKLLHSKLLRQGRARRRGERIPRGRHQRLPLGWPVRARAGCGRTRPAYRFGQRRARVPVRLAYRFGTRMLLAPPSRTVRARASVRKPSDPQTVEIPKCDDFGGGCVNMAIQKQAVVSRARLPYRIADRGGGV